MTRILSAACVLVLFVLATATYPNAAPVVATQGTRTVLVIGEGSASEQRSTASRLEAMIDSGQLRLIDQREDPMLAGRAHSRYQQTYNGLPVLGADVAVQRSGAQIVTALGIIFEGLAIDTDAPVLSFAQASQAVATQGVRLLSTSAPLSILPAADGSVSLVYTANDDAGFASYINANTGVEMMRINQMQRQGVVQRGTGGLGDSKKVSGTIAGGTIVAVDSLRPPAIETHDLRGVTNRADAITSGVLGLITGDLAAETGPSWTDSAVVDAHVHAGFVYDYLYRRFQRRGLDNNNARIQSIVHPALQQNARIASSATIGRYFLNAFYSTRCRCIVYGEGIPAGVFSNFPQGVRNFATALDVVAHELTHAVTDASSRLVYANESGALNEAFSDIIGTSVEQFFQPAGTGPGRADYLLGEDLAPTGTDLLRSMSDPRQHNQPDHFGNREYIGSPYWDQGGVHINSGIANNAFYLAVEGGTNATSRRVVTGVGAANKEQIERVFYRAFTSLLPSNASFYLARVATIQSARDLYGSGSAADRAVTSAWDAVGVTSPAAAITTTFSPRSVSPSSVSCSGSSVQPSFTFRVSLREFQQVGYTVSRFVIYSLDSQGRPLGASQFSAATFQSWFGECQAGNTRIANGATACATICGNLGGRSGGYALLEFYGSDDNGNTGVFLTDPVSLGLPALYESEGPATTPTFTKAVRQ